MMIYIGIDPGQKGAYCVMSEDGVSVHPWNETDFIVAMRDARRQANDSGEGIVAAVEKVGARPGQGTVSMFTFGKNAGKIEGVLMTLGIPYQLVPPQNWKREFSLIKAEKRKSIETAKKLFPGVSLLPGERCRADSDGMAEAILICEYARRRM